MDKLIKEGFIALAIGAAVVFGLAQINYLKILKLDSSKGNLFSLAGKYYIEDLQKTSEEIKDQEAKKFIDSLRNRICLANDLDTSLFQIYLFHDYNFNAYAIPGNFIVMNSEVIQFAENADEVASVLAHEIAHHQKDHVRKSMVGQIGLQVILATVTGTVSDNLSYLLTQIGWSKYSRSNEQDADDEAVKYLQNAKINPLHMAQLFQRMDKELDKSGEGGVLDIEMLSSHPDTKARAKRIKSLTKRNINYQSAYEQLAFEALKNKLIDRTGEK